MFGTILKTVGILLGLVTSHASQNQQWLRLNGSDLVVSWYAPELKGRIAMEIGNKEIVARGSNNGFHHAVTEAPYHTVTYRIPLGNNEWSNRRMMLGLSEDEHTMAIVGDLGMKKSSKQIREAMEKDESLDSLLLVGDLAYSSRGDGWDKWRQAMEPLAGRLPTQILRGNHDPLSMFQKRFAMEKEYYWYRAGPVFVVGLSSYLGKEQEGFLRETLKNVNRTVTPWVVVAYHAPIYNSNKRHRPTTAFQERFEPLFKDVADLAVAGHVHAYERFVPRKGDRTAHVTVGTGGAYLYNHWHDHPKYEGKRANGYGYGRLHATRKTLVWEWIKADSREVQDRVVLS